MARMSEKSPRRTSAPKSAGAASVTDAVLSEARLVLVHGKEDFLAERAIDRVVSLARDRDPNFQRCVVRADADSAVTDLADALAPTLFDDPSVVIIAAADSADDRFLGLLGSSIADLGESRCIVVWHPAGPKGRAVADKVKALGAVVLVCEPMKSFALPGFVQAELQKHARKATEGAVELLVTAIGEDLRGLAAAVAQLASDVPADPIDEAAVLAYHDGVADVKGWDVSDALWGLQPDAVLTALRHAEQIKPGSGPAYTASLGSGLRSLVRFAGAPRGASDADIAREVGVPPFKVRIIRAQLARWTPSQLAGAVRRIAEADHQVKGRTETGDGVDPALQAYALERAVISILASRTTE